MEKYFSDDINPSEYKELQDALSSNAEFRKEFEEQKKIKEVLHTMNLKNPSREVWDKYWTGIYNRIERGIAWIAISIGAIILFGFAVFEAIEHFIDDTTTPDIVKMGVGVLTVGGIILTISVLREKLMTYKHDKYKDIQR